MFGELVKTVIDGKRLVWVWLGN